MPNTRYTVRCHSAPSYATLRNPADMSLDGNTIESTVGLPPLMSLTAPDECDVDVAYMRLGCDMDVTWIGGVRPTEGLTTFRDVMNETREMGFDVARERQIELGVKVRYGSMVVW